jgi:hypothetical protein
MQKWLFSLVLGVGLSGCATEELARDQAPSTSPNDENDDDDGDDDTSARDAGKRDAGKMDAGKAKIDAGKKMDAAVIVCGEDGGTITPPPGKPDPSGGAIGDGCESDDDCSGDGVKCLTNVMLPFGGITVTYPGGYCTKACAADDECDDGASCPLAAAASFAEGISNCMKRCDSADECRDGYSCGTVPSLGGAAPADPQKSCLPPRPEGLPTGPAVAP